MIIFTNVKLELINYKSDNDKLRKLIHKNLTIIKLIIM